MIDFIVIYGMFSLLIWCLLLRTAQSASDFLWSPMRALFFIPLIIITSIVISFSEEDKK